MAFHKTIVIDVVGLTRDLISAENTPNLFRWMQKDSMVATVEPAFPAVTCVPQTTYLTGKTPCEHGIVGNGFYDKEYCEVRNWHQSAKQIRSKRIFETIKEIAQARTNTSHNVKNKSENGSDPHEFPTTFSNCWWFPMYDYNLDYVVTPRPQYLQNGGKLADVYTHPAPLRDQLQGKLGQFPLHRFWGPMTSIESSQWIAEAAKLVDQWHNPTLSLIYLPHLDYCLQKYGPDNSTIVPQHLREIDQVVHSLIEFYEKQHGPDVRIMILSEYGISPVNKVIHINKVLREHGYISVRRENYGETLDCGASAAFAVSDHQVAHVYVQNPKKDLENVRRILKDIPGVEMVLDLKEQNTYYQSTRPKIPELNDVKHDIIYGAYHPDRSGDLLAVAESNAWFSYYYWQDSSQAPDFARCVAIHRKPGYDPAEMFFRYQPEWLGKLYLFFKIFLVYVLKYRGIVDASPLEADNIRGSHGRVPKEDKYKPLFVSNYHTNLGKIDRIRAEDVHDLILRAVTDE